MLRRRICSAAGLIFSSRQYLMFNFSFNQLSVKRWAVGAAVLAVSCSLTACSRYFVGGIAVDRIPETSRSNLAISGCKIFIPTTEQMFVQ